MKTTHRLIGVLLTLSAVAALFRGFPGALTAAAAGTNEVLPGVDSRVLLRSLDLLEDDFNRPTVDWEVSGASAEAVTSLDRPPYSVYEGSRSLLLTAEQYTAGDAITLERKPEHFSSPEQYGVFSVTVWAPESAGEVLLSLGISSRGGSYSSVSPVATGSWQTVFFDLSKSELSGRVSSLELSVTSSESGSFRFLIDLCGASSAAAAGRARYMADSYAAVGCTLTENRGVLSAELTAPDAYLEAAAPYVTDFSGESGIRVRLINRSSCRSITLTYTSLSSPEFDGSLSYTCRIPEGSGVVSCTFPIPEAYIGKFRLVFDGLCSGSIELLSVSPALSYILPDTVGEVTDCLVSSDRKNIVVKGQLDPEEAARYADSQLYLYELELWEEAGAVSTERTAIAITRLSGSGFSFSLPLSSQRRELYKKYAVFVYYADSLVQVGSPVSVTNPEALSGDRLDFSSSSIKGSYPTPASPVLDGIAHTAVEIRLEELMTLGVTGILTHTAGDVTCTLDAAYVEELDRLMSLYQRCGIRVQFILRTGYSDDISLDSVIRHPNASGGSSAAFNTATAEGIGALRAVCDFLAVRYATASGVTSNAEGFVVGAGINDAARCYNMGEATLTQLTRSYAAAFRTVYNTVRSVSSEVSVYLPLTGKWYSHLTVGQTSSFDARTMLEAFAACIAEGGDIGWKLSYDLYEDRPLLYWEDPHPDRSEETARLSVPNLSVLTGFLKREELLFNGSPRNIILLQTEPETLRDGNELIRRSADFVCSYLHLTRREFSTVTALIPAHPVDYNDTLRYLDTNRFEETTAYVRELVGDELFDSLVAAAPAPDRLVFENKAVTVIPSAVKGETVLFGFGEDEAGWTALTNCAALKGGSSLGDRSGLLSVRFSAADGGEYRSIDNRFERAIDLSVVDYIGFELQAAVLPEGVETLEVSVVLWSGASRSVSSCTVPAGTLTTVIADLTAFPKRSSCDRMTILIRGENGEDIGEPTVLFGSIRAMSTTRTGQALESAIRPGEEELVPTVRLTVVAAAGGVLLAAAGIELLRLRARRRQGREP